MFFFQFGGAVGGGGSAGGPTPDPRSVSTRKVEPQGPPLRARRPTGPPRPGAEGLRQGHSATQTDAALCGEFLKEGIQAHGGALRIRGLFEAITEAAAPLLLVTSIGAI